MGLWAIVTKLLRVYGHTRYGGCTRWAWLSCKEVVMYSPAMMVWWSGEEDVVVLKGGCDGIVRIRWF